MAYRGSYFVQDNFDGGYGGHLPSTDLALNQAADLDNVIVGPDGKSFRTPWPTVRLNATAMGSANSYPVIGVGYKPHSGTLFVRNGAVYGANTYGVGGGRDSQTFSDITGAVTITTAASASGERTNYRWSFVNFDSLIIGFGGDLVNGPDAPIKWSGSGNVAALGGSPPSAKFGISANNRLFAFTSTTMYWTIIGDCEDWSGAGSGSTVIGNLDDGDSIRAAVVFPNQVMLVFKGHSIYQVNLTAAPFGNYLAFGGIGSVCPSSVVMVDGMCYFIDQYGKMRMTDGSSLSDPKDLPYTLMNNVDLSSIDYGFPIVNGYRQKTLEYDWVVWTWLNSDLINYTTIVYDLKLKCWLRNSVGFNFLSGVVTDGSVFIGGGTTDGRLYWPDAEGYGTNDTDGTTTITSYWRTGWITQKTLEKILQFRRFGLSLKTQTSGKTPGSLSNSWTVTYGFNFLPDTASSTISAAPSATEPETFRFFFPKGQGAATQYKISWTGTDQSNFAARINSIQFAGKAAGQGRIK